MEERVFGRKGHAPPSPWNGAQSKRGRVNYTPSVRGSDVAREFRAAQTCDSGSDSAGGHDHNSRPGHREAADGHDTADRHMLGDIPWLTIALTCALALVFALQIRLAFDPGADGKPDIYSLVAQGAASRTLVVAGGEWWRLLLAPMLHGGNWHLAGNCLALVLAGFRLEGLIGRSWLLAVFAGSALAGALASIWFNPPDVPTVGASGAVCGLLAALFTVSFFVEADPDDAWRMQRLALFFGVPALLPLFLGARGNTDYFAHAGGAAAGCAIACMCLIAMSDEAIDRPAEWAARAFAALWLVLAGTSAAMAAAHFPAHAARSADRIPAAAMPHGMRAGGRLSEDLLTRYPNDPRAHLMRGLYLADNGGAFAAERALLNAKKLAAPDPFVRGTGEMADAILAYIMLKQQRMGEARSYARAVCVTRRPGDLFRAFERARLCS
ncbi:MAG: rhomboid family intramembrane serine protease [Beijerinckiaceae bacterium]